MKRKTEAGEQRKEEGKRTREDTEELDELAKEKERMEGKVKRTTEREKGGKGRKRE